MRSKVAATSRESTTDEELLRTQKWDSDTEWRKKFDRTTQRRLVDDI